MLAKHSLRAVQWHSLACALLYGVLHVVLASETADAKTRAEPTAGYSAPGISAQALDSQSPVMATARFNDRWALMNEVERDLQRDIAQLKERAERTATARAAGPTQNRRTNAPRIDTGPTASPAEAAWLLGLVYAHGAGVPQDLAQAQVWFERAAAQGQTQAPLAMVWCALAGCKGPSDTRLARARMGALRNSQSSRALYLQWLVNQQINPVVAIAPHGAAEQPGTEELPRESSKLPVHELLVQAANLGDMHALLELGLEAVAFGRTPRARQFFEQAAAAGSVAAAHNLRLLNKQLADKDTPAVGNTQMDGNALLRLAQRNHRGEGQSANYSEAIRLYRMAQAQGSKAAADMLALIFSRPTATGQLDIAWMQRLAPLEGVGLVSVAVSTAGTQLFQRERSPLFDYLPTLWKSRVGSIY